MRSGRRSVRQARAERRHEVIFRALYVDLHDDPLRLAGQRGDLCGVIASASHSMRPRPAARTLPMLSPGLRGEPSGCGPDRRGRLC